VSSADALQLPLQFHLIVPRFARDTPACQLMASSPRVRWHADLRDEDLREVYRRADLLVLPLLDSTANNGLLEGLACGLPAIVTDVGGVREYTRDTFADLVPVGDAATIVAILQRHLRQRDALPERAAAARRHIEHHLTWRQSARQFVSILASLA
jgi:glycosyltransferase involved in cell wall biosynthesis